MESTKNTKDTKDIEIAMAKRLVDKFKLIPPGSIEAMADRFELGVKNKKPEEVWNHLMNPQKLDDLHWIRERVRHGREHLLHFLDVMNGTVLDDGDDDGAAVMWLGSMMHEAWVRRKNKLTEEIGNNKAGGIA